MPTHDIETYHCQCGWQSSGSRPKMKMLIRLHHKKCDVPYTAVNGYECVNFEMGKDKIVKDTRSAATKSLAFGHV